MRDKLKENERDYLSRRDAMLDAPSPAQPGPSWSYTGPHKGTYAVFDGKGRNVADVYFEDAAARIVEAVNRSEDYYPAALKTAKDAARSWHEKHDDARADLAACVEFIEGMLPFMDTDSEETARDLLARLSKSA